MILFNRLRYFIVIFPLLVSTYISSQSKTDGNPDASSKYMEDQFYMSLGFNFLLDKPENVVQRSLSYNLQTGFIKDIPLNINRNFGLGLGLGYATNSYYSNIGARKIGNNIVYEVLGSSEFKRSKFETHAVEVPLEIRWRTSTPEEYKFWRIYTGVKFGYVFLGRSKLVTDDEVIGFSNDDIQKLQYGLMFNFGFNTWNVHAYYALNPLLEDGTTIDEGNPIDLRVLRIGVIFYIL